MQGPIPTRINSPMPENTGLCVIGNIPISWDESDGAVSSQILNMYIQSFTIHGLSVNTTKAAFMDYRATIPTPNASNDFKKTLSIQMLLDDRLDNWFLLYRYLRTLLNPRDGYPSTDRTARPFHPAGPHAQRRMFTDYIEIRIGDSNLELFNIYTFKHLFLTDISDIQFTATQSTSEYKTFTSTWTYDNIEIQRIEQDLSRPRTIND